MLLLTFLGPIHRIQNRDGHFFGFGQKLNNASTMVKHIYLAYVYIEKQ